MKKCWCGNEKMEDFCEGYYFCKKCGSLITKENLSVATVDLNDSTDFYGKSYWENLMMSRAHTKNLSELIDLYLGERAAYWLSCLYKYLLPGHGSVAEIGCGMGQFSYLLKCSGYSETAFDLSPAICDYISKELSINVVNSAFVKSENKYDAIVAMDLLEHLEEPVQFIKDVYLSLTDGGMILFQTPCFNDETDYETIVNDNPRFLSLMSPNEHLILFSRKSIRTLLEEAGFKDIRFLDAYFGNNYDMFVAASKHELHEYTEEEIKSELYKQPFGRVLNALIQSALERTQLIKVVENLSSQCEKSERDQEWLMDKLASNMRRKTLFKKNHPDLCIENLNLNDDIYIRYSDGWIGKYYSEKIILDVRDDKLVISGSNLLFENGGINMTVYIDGKYADSKPCPLGKFLITVPIDRPRKSAEVSLVFNKTMVPADNGTSEDCRNLSIILASIYGQSSQPDVKK